MHKQSVLQLRNGNGTVCYVTCKELNYSDTDNEILLSGLYGYKNRLNHESKAILTIECESPTLLSDVCVEPETMNDWELIEMHSDFIENNLLHQIRCVSPELIVPVWVEEICIFIQIKSLSPSVPFGLLTVSTQVHIIPKSSTISSNSLVQKPVESGPEPNTSSPTVTADSKTLLKSDSIKSNIWNRLIRLLDFLYSIIFRKSFTVWRRQKYFLTSLCDRLTSVDGTASCVGRVVSLDRLVKSNAMQLSPMSQEDLCHSSTALLFVNPNSPLADRSSIVMKVQPLLPPGSQSASSKSMISIYLLVRISITIKVPNNSILILAVSEQIITEHDMNIGDRVMLIPHRLCNSKLCPNISLHVEEKTQRLGCIYESAFRNFVKQTSSFDSPILVYPNMPLTISLDAENAIKMTIHFDNSKCDKDTEFYLLTELMLKGIRIQIVIDQYSHKHKPKLSNYKNTGFQSTFNRLSKFCETFLYSHTSASVLLLGSEASGKSKLIERLQYYLADQPFLQAQTRIISCKALIGKQVEGLRRQIDSVITQSLWHCPALLCLEDLDSLTPRSPEVTTNPQEEFLQNLIAETIRCAILKVKRSGCPVVILATARHIDNLHERLGFGRGSTLFDNYLEMEPLDKMARSNILRDLTLRQLQSVSSTSSSNGSLSEADFSYLSDVTGSHVVGDLERLVTQTLSTSMCRQADNSPLHLLDSDSEKCVTLSDFKVTLSTFQPLAFTDLQDNAFLEKFSLDDIGGLEDVKTRLIETFVWPVKYPNLFAQSPIKLQHGALLYGPPGCGKTLTALALAKESNMKLLLVKGPELLDKHIGASETAVRELMARARKVAPALILFDEFESLAPRRGHDSTGVTDRVVNQLLTELDGVNGLGDVFIIATSNRPDLIDPALLRPGRIQMKIYCPLPDENARQEILSRMNDPQSVHQCLPLCQSVDIAALSRNTESFTAADLLGVLNRAGIEAMKRNHLFASGGDSISDPEISLNESDIRINEGDIDFALRNVRPSLKQKQLEQYLTIYRDFQSTTSTKQFDANSSLQTSAMKATLN